MPLTDLLFSSAPGPEEKPGTMARLGLSNEAVAPEHVISDTTKLGGKEPIEDSNDLQRVLALPRRPKPTHEQQKAMAAEMTALLRIERTTPCDCAALNPGAIARGQNPCITEFNGPQGWYLYEVRTYGGAFGIIPVGGGKTGIDIFIPMVRGGKTYVLMLPPSLVAQFNRDFRLWSQHFRTPNLAGSNGPHDPTRPTLRVLKYSELSRPNFSTWLKAMKPDGIGCDESHLLKDRTAVRTDRFIRYFAEAEIPVWLCAHSGSPTTRGIEDMGHMMGLCLRGGSPLPLDPSVTTRWGLVLNPAIGRAPSPMGALRHFCKPGETVREGFRRRLVETPGIITVTNSDIGVPLTIRKRDPGPLPPVIKAALSITRGGKRPDGEEFDEQMEQVKVARQVASGFFYRWRFPKVFNAFGGLVEDDEGREEVILEWLGRRAAWAKELRTKMEHGRIDEMDSPALLEEAAERSLQGYTGPLPKWRTQCLAPWREFETRVEYETETIWLDDFIVQDAKRWLSENVGVCWYWHSALGKRLSEVTGLPTYQSKTTVLNLNPTPAMLARRQALLRIGEWEENAASWLGVEDGTRPIICGIKPFHFGVNLQSFHRMLVLNNPADAGIWEQLLGRFHRFLQMRPVICDVYRHTSEVSAALDDARERSEYVEQLTGKSEKLIFATCDFMGGLQDEA